MCTGDHGEALTKALTNRPARLGSQAGGRQASRAGRSGGRARGPHHARPTSWWREDEGDPTDTPPWREAPRLPIFLLSAASAQSLLGLTTAGREPWALGCQQFPSAGSGRRKERCLAGSRSAAAAAPAEEATGCQALPPSASGPERHPGRRGPSQPGPAQLRGVRRRRKQGQGDRPESPWTLQNVQRSREGLLPGKVDGRLAACSVKASSAAGLWCRRGASEQRHEGPASLRGTAPSAADGAFLRPNSSPFHRGRLATVRTQIARECARGRVAGIHSQGQRPCLSLASTPRNGSHFNAHSFHWENENAQETVGACAREQRDCVVQGNCTAERVKTADSMLPVLYHDEKSALVIGHDEKSALVIG